MKCFLVVSILCAAAGYAQTNGSAHSESAGPGKAPGDDSATVLCTLETVTWNPETAELSWVVSLRALAAGKDHPAVQEKYTIHVDDATMNSKGEARRFDPEEARQVAKIMDLISNYTIESTVWWSKGLGEKVDGTQAPQSEPKQPDKKKEDKGAPMPIGMRVAAMPDAPAQSLLAPSPRVAK